MKTKFLLFTLSFIFFSITIHSQVFVKQNATGNNDGSSWENAYTNFQTALDNAAEGDQLWIAAGVYKPELSPNPEDNWFEMNKGLELYGGFDGTETMLDQRDWQVNGTILSGDIEGDDESDDFINFKSDNAAHILRINNNGNANIVDGFKIIGGHAQIENYPGNVSNAPWRGGGIEFIADNLLIRNCQISQCNANWGAAIWGFSLGYGEVNIKIEDNVIMDNNSRYGCTSFINMEYMEVKRCFFENNYGIEFAGGMLIGNSNALLEDCIFQNNEVDLSTIGAGVFFFQNSANSFSNPLIEVKNCEFLNNIGGAGSGIMMNNFFGGSELSVDSCHFFQNTGYFNGFGGGAGIACQNFEDNFGGGTPSLSVSVTNSTFEENGSDYGGATYFYSNSDTMNVHMDNNEFVKNSSIFDGGAVYLNSDQYLNAQLERLKFSENDADGQGSAIAMDGVEVRIANSLVNDNLGNAAISNTSGDLFLAGNTIVNNNIGLYQGFNGNTLMQNTILSNEVNYSSQGGASVTTRGGNLSSDSLLINDLIGFGNYPDYNGVDPQLDMDFIPEENSVCVDGGNPDSVSTTTDLAGVDRIQGSEIDMGAFESSFDVAVDDFEKLGIDVYPNPFIDQIFISDIEEIKSIRLINVEGRVLQSFQVQSELFIQNDLPVGIYFLELNYGEKQYYAKLEKHR